MGSMDRRNCRESIEEKPKNLDGSRICQDGETQKSRWIENPSRFVEKRRKNGSIEVNLSSLKKEGFSRREKHKEMNATKKLLKQGSNQHIKLKTSLNIYAKDSRSKTHTNTLNKSNQFYISETS